MSIDLLVRHISRLCCREDVHPNVVIKEISKMNWEAISSYQVLSEDFIKRF